MDALLCRRVLIHFPIPLPSLEDGAEASSHGLVFLATSPHPEAIQEPPRVPSLE